MSGRSIDLTRWALIGAAGVVAAILGVSLSLLVFGPSGGGATQGKALIGGPFELVNQDREPVDESVLLGRVSLVYFGYTFCPDFCPTELNNLAIAKDRLAAKGVESRIVFITIDPERDTPEVLKEYVAYFDEAALGLSGTAEQTAAVAKAYRVIYRKAEDEDFPDGYAMDHTTFVYAMDAKGEFITHFGPATDPDEIADKIAGALSSG